MNFTEFVGSQAWPYVSAATYTFGALALILRWAMVPSSAPVGLVHPQLRQTVRFLLWATTAMIAWHWCKLAVDPNLDRSQWSEGLTPYSAGFGVLIGLPALLDLHAWQAIKRGRVDADVD